MENNIPLTKSKYDELAKKLKYLETSKRTEISDAIKTAKEFGDLSENAEYSAAKDAQEKLEIEIAQLQEILNKAYPLEDKDIDCSKVCIGTKVRLFDEFFDEEVVYQLVSSYEASSAENKISDQSPIGKAIVGKKKDDRAEVKLPTGHVTTLIIRDVFK